MTPAAIRALFLNSISSSGHQLGVEQRVVGSTIRAVASVREASGSLNVLILVSAEQRRAARCRHCFTDGFLKDRFPPRACRCLIPPDGRLFTDELATSTQLSSAVR
jgi:hypothetical protein